MHNLDLLRIVLALVPALLFLAALRALDSYKLVSLRTVFGSLAAGALAAAISYACNSFVFRHFPGHQDQYSMFGAPLLEELAKGAFWIALIAMARTVFMADSAICGFAIGTGFALTENIAYLRVLEGKGLNIWLVRGFGTALMHGGVSAIGATLSVYLLESGHRVGIRLFVPGMLAAVLLHSTFNQSLESPVASTIAAMVGLPLVLAGTFYFSELSLRAWLTDKLDRDIDFLSDMGSREFCETRVGSYLMSLQESFSPSVCGDMLSLLQLTSELSMRAKSDLLLEEAGMTLEPDPELDAMFVELEYLTRNIGPTGMLAIRPLLAQTPRDLWEMHRLRKGMQAEAS